MTTCPWDTESPKGRVDELLSYTQTTGLGPLNNFLRPNTHISYWPLVRGPDLLAWGDSYPGKRGLGALRKPFRLLSSLLVAGLSLTHR